MRLDRSRHASGSSAVDSSPPRWDTCSPDSVRRSRCSPGRPRLLRGFDADIAERFTELFAKRVDLRLGHVPTSIRRVADGHRDLVRRGDVVVDELLVATGREPNTDLLDTRRRRHRTATDHGTDRDRRHDGHERRRGLGDRRRRQRPPVEASRQRRGHGRVLEHRPSGRSTPAELQGRAERRVLEPAGGHGRPDRAASGGPGPVVRRRYARLRGHGLRMGDGRRRRRSPR